MRKHDASRTDPCGGGAIEAEDRVQYRQYCWFGAVEAGVAAAGQPRFPVAGRLPQEPLSAPVAEAVRPAGGVPRARVEAAAVPRGAEPPPSVPGALPRGSPGGGLGPPAAGLRSAPPSPPAASPRSPGTKGVLPAVPVADKQAREDIPAPLPWR